MKYIDIHGHVNFSAYDADREDVIRRAEKAGVTMFTVGTNFTTSKTAIDLAHKYQSIYAVVGLHPIYTSRASHDEKELSEDNEDDFQEEIPKFELYKELASDQKVVAIGECGLDYYHLDEKSFDKQVQAFETMIDVANEVKKPLMLHLRSGVGRSAYLDAHEIIKSKSKVVANLHFFSGNIDEARLFLDLGCTFSFNGVITFARNYDEVIKYLPADRIMSETDCPYLSPVPFRGKRNEPINVIETVKMLAKIRDEEENIIVEKIIKNAKKCFSLESVPGF